MIFVGSGSLLWRAVEHARSVGCHVSLVVHTADEAAPAWADDLRCEATFDVNQLADVFAAVAASDEVVWSTGNPFIFRKPILDLELPIYNVHGGPLPDYRGLPMVGAAYAILNGENRFGVTVHRVDQGIDTGETVEQLMFDLSGDITLDELTLLVSDKCHDVFVACLDRVRGGEVGSTAIGRPAPEVDAATGSYYGVRELARIGTHANDERFHRATSLGVLAEVYQFYSTVFEFARTGLEDMTSIIADLRFWWTRGQTTAPGTPIEPDGLLAPSSARSVEYVQRALDSSAIAAVRKVSQRDGFPVATVMIGAMGIALSEETNDPAVEMGVPVDGVAGAVPLRLNTAISGRGERYLAEVQRTVGDAVEHTSIPLSNISDAMGARALQTTVSVCEEPRDSESPGVQELSRFDPVDQGISDLAFDIRWSSAGIAIGCSYVSELFTRRTIERLIDRACAALSTSTASAHEVQSSEDTIDSAVEAAVRSELDDGHRVDLLARSDREAGLQPSGAWMWVRRVVNLDELPTPAVVDAFVRCVRAFGLSGDEGSSTPASATLRSLVHVVTDVEQVADSDSPAAGSVQIRIFQESGLVRRAVLIAAGDVDAVTVELFTGALDKVAVALSAGDRVTFSPDERVESAIEQREQRAASAEILDIDHWITFAEEHTERELVAVRRDRQGTAVHEHECVSDLAPLDIAATTLIWIAGEFAATDPEGLFCDVETSSCGPGVVDLATRAAARYPVFIDAAVGDVAPGVGAGDALRSAGVMPPDDRTASDFDLLYWDNDQTEGMFDEVPKARILLRIADGDSDIRAIGDGSQRGRYSVVVSIVRGVATSDDGTRNVRMLVQTDSGITLDSGALVEELTSIGAAGHATPGAERSGFRNIVDSVVTVEPARVVLADLSVPEKALAEGAFGNVADVLPLSPLQEGFFYHLQMANEAGTTDLYASQSRTRVRGNLDCARMGDAIAELLIRNPNLTAGFMTVGDRSIQVIPSGVRTPVRVLRLHDWSESGNDVGSILEKERAAPFYAQKPPLIRFLLLEEAPQDWLVAVTFEHLLFDGWSLGLIWDELFALYADLGGASIPDRLPYRDYAEWLAARDVDSARESWREYFGHTTHSDGIDPTIVAPAALDTPASAGEAADVYRFLAPDLYARISAACRESGVTIGTFLHVAWGVTLARLINRPDVVFGTSVSGRPPELAGSEATIGLLFNTVPVHVAVGRDLTVRRALRDHQSRNAGVMDAFYVSLNDIQQIAGTSQLFDTLFIIQNHPGAAKDTGVEFGPNGSQIKVVSGQLNDSTHYPLSFAAYPGEQMQIRCSYRGDVYSAAEVDRVIDRLELVIAAMVADLDAAVGQISITLPADLDEFNRWNSTTRPVDDVTIAELIVAQSVRTPGAIAVVAGDVRLSFDDLVTRARIYAELLISRGVRVEDRVALLLPRDERTIVALFGVFFAGAAYVPVDGDYPSERIEYILEASKPAVVLTTGEYLDRLPANGAFDVLDLDALHRTGVITPGTGPFLKGDVRTPVRVDADNLAYVIFTSGSTGRPKGVAVGQRGLTNMYFNHERKIFDPVVAHQGGRRMKIAHTTSFSFDASWEQLFWLLNGHQVHVISDDLRKDPSLLLDYYDRERIDGFDVTPSYGEVLTEAGLLNRPRPSGDSTDESDPGVVFVSLGGEAVPESLWTELRIAPGVESFNLYGPTEYTINALGADLADSPTSNAGTPIDNTRAYVLDSNLGLTPPGTPGELYLSGAGLARGYFSRSALTSERFVADPFNDGQRLYRTGDLVRWRPDGQIDYLGRTDDQVKIRGFRVELGEIAETIRVHPDVSAATVITVHPDDDSGRQDVQLAAYYSGPEFISGDEIRSLVAQRLPAYMVPASYQYLTALPLTTNGKIDGKALPKPDLDALAAPSRSPRTETERDLCEIYADVLGVDSVGVDDDFLTLGGHSLLAIRVVNRIGASRGFKVPLRSFFDRPTVAEMAALIDDNTDNTDNKADNMAGTDSGSGDALALTRITEPPREIPLSFAQQRMWVLYQVEGPSPTYNIPILWRAPGGSLDIDSLQAAATDVVRRHRTLRTTFPSIDGRGVQNVEAVDSPLPFEHRYITVDDLADVVGELSRYTFELDTELPIRIAALEYGDEHLVVMVVHHIAIDEWSMRSLTDDLDTAYQARCGGMAPEFDSLPVEYTDYTLWERGRLGDRADPRSLGARQLAFWRRTLADAPAELVLPLDRPRPAQISYRGANVEIRCDAERTGRLRAVADRHQVSMFMLIHAAVAVTLHRSGSGPDIVIGTPISGRNDHRLENLVGFFLNTVVLRTDLSGDPSLTEVLARVRDGDLAAFDHQDVPFEHVVDAVGAPRTMSMHPLFQVMVVYIGPVGGSTDAIAGRSDESDTRDLFEGTGTGTAKFDLSFDFADDSEEIAGVVEYATDLFDHRTVSALVDRLQRVLEVFAEQIDDPVSRIDVLGDERTLITRPPTPANLGSEVTISDVLADRVRRDPDAVAVIDRTAQWTFAELDARVRRVARRLQSLGAGPETIVVVCLPRTSDYLAVMFGVLAAGAAYLPVDPTAPQSRVQAMIRGAGPVVAVVDDSTSAAIGEELLKVSPDSMFADDDPGSITCRALADSPAYVLFTSGTTGRPKGVVVTHRGLVNLYASHRRTLHDRVTGATGRRHLRVGHAWSFAFDASWQPLLWLLSGHTLDIVDEDTQRDPDALLARLREQEWDFLELTPSYIEQLLERGLGTEVPIAMLGFGGEAVTPSLWARLGALAATSAVNLYGPTESTVDAMVGLVADSERPVIGRPVDGTTAYVLDGSLNPVPLGVEGELYLAGEGLARGYLGRRALTAERFVADPFGPGRMYRTGDMARWTFGGLIEYRGRTDNQVKIRGFRIELGEVESALTGLGGVSEAVVEVRESVFGVKHLVAYVVGDQSVDVRGEAAKVLPDYMVPAAVVGLDALPLLPNGKLNRAALPAPSVGSVGAEPSTATERTLCSVIADTLGLSKVGADADFFELGGDSIVAMQLVSAARARGIRFSPRDVFNARSAVGLAVVAQSDSVPRAVEIATGSVALTPVMHWLRELDTSAPRTTDGFHQSVVLQTPADLDPAVLVATLDAIARQHDILRARVVVDGSDWTLDVPESVDVESWFVRLPASGDQSADLESAARAAQARLDPRGGVMVRVSWIDAGSKAPGRLIITAHHLVVDGVSWRILIPDLVRVYGALSDGLAATFPDKGTAFRTWSDLLNERAGDRLDELGLWETILGDIDPLPLKQAIDPKTDLAGVVETVATWSEPELTEDLLGRAPAAYGVGVMDLMIAALSVALAQWRHVRSDGPDVQHMSSALIDLERHGRQEVLGDVDLSSTVGWFTAIHPLRLDGAAAEFAAILAGDPVAARAMVQRVRTRMDEIPDDGIGYGMLRYLLPDSPLAKMHSPAIEFNYLGQLSGAQSGDWSFAADGAPVNVGPPPAMPFGHALVIDVSTLDTPDGQQVNAIWRFPSTLLDQDDVRFLAEAWHASLAAIVSARPA
jgi:amino acid adenylation domain-containing protein/non-ribosomal peptide synthase protein (TIGR01720 family)